MKWQQIFKSVYPGRRVPTSPYRKDHLDLIATIYMTDLFRFLGAGICHTISERIAERLDTNTFSPSSVHPLLPRARPTIFRALKLALYPGHYSEYYDADGEPPLTEQEFLAQIQLQQYPWPQGRQGQPDSAYGSSPPQSLGGHHAMMPLMTPFSQTPYAPSFNDSTPDPP